MARGPRHEFGYGVQLREFFVEVDGEFSAPLGKPFAGGSFRFTITKLARKLLPIFPACSKNGALRGQKSESDLLVATTSGSS